MSHTSLRRPSVDRPEPLKGKWQRSLLVEYALVALLVAFTGIHFLFVFIGG